MPKPICFALQSLDSFLGVTCKILKYDDLRHALSDSCKQEGDVWVNVLLWFVKHFVDRRKNEDRLRSCINKMLDGTKV